MAPQSDESLRFGDIVVEVKRGAVVLVHADKDSVTVCNIHDSKKDAVVVLLPGGRRSVGVGEELQVKQRQSLPERPGNKQPGRRAISESNLTASLRIVHSEVSIPSLFSCYEVMAALRQANTRVSREILSKVLKTATALQMVTAAHGPYSH